MPPKSKNAWKPGGPKPAAQPQQQQQGRPAELAKQEEPESPTSPKPMGSPLGKVVKPAPPQMMALRTNDSVSLCVFNPPQPGATPLTSSSSASFSTPKSAGHADPTALARASSTTTEDAASSCVQPLAATALSGDFSDSDLVFSNDGRFYATANQTTVTLVECATGKVVKAIEEKKVVELCFSSQDTFLVTYRQQMQGQTEGNLAIWRVGSSEDAEEKDSAKEEAKTSETNDKKEDAESAAAVSDGSVFRFRQGQWPALFWTPDEKFMVRSAQGVVHVHDGTLKSTEVVSRLGIELPQNKKPVLSCPTSKNAPPLLAMFLPWHGQRMNGEVHVFRLPDLKTDLMMSAFAKGESAEMQWSPSGRHLTVISKIEVDKSHQSYYGTTTLRVLNVGDRTSANVTLGSGEGIHAVEWSPTSNEFIVIHGPMPENSITLYNEKGEPTFQFGKAARNVIRWAPNGKLFFAGGTGNLAGQTQVYDRSAAGKKSDCRLGFFVDKCSLMNWAPDSRHIITTTVFSHLRLSNKYIIWKYTGEKIATANFGQLYTAAFAPVPVSAFPERPLSPGPVKTEAEAKPQAYRAPHRSEAAAASLARNTGNAFGHTVKPKGPVGAQLAEEPKKKKKR